MIALVYIFFGCKFKPFTNLENQIDIKESSNLFIQRIYRWLGRIIYQRYMKPIDTLLYSRLVNSTGAGYHPLKYL